MTIILDHDQRHSIPPRPPFVVRAQCGRIRTNPNYVEALFEMEHLTQWLTSLLLNTQYPSTRPAVSMALQMLSRMERVAPIKVLNELIRILHSERSRGPNCSEFLDLLLETIDHVFFCGYFWCFDVVKRMMTLLLIFDRIHYLISFQITKPRETRS